MLTAALITIESAFVADAPALSVTLAVKLLVPEVVGVPVIAPVELLRDNPAGSVPDESDHVSGAVPPVAAKV